MFNFLNKKNQNKKETEQVADETLQHINEDLYKHNLEIAVKNKTLSLLNGLYEISVLALLPEALAQKTTGEILKDLNLEFVGMYSFSKKDSVFSPLGFAYGQKWQDAQKNHEGFSVETFGLTSQGTLVEAMLKTKNMQYSFSIEALWDKDTDTKILKQVNDEAHIRTVLLFPLISQGEIIGALVLGLNHVYDTLADYEKESIRSVVNVTSVALDKALLYNEINLANEKLTNADKLKTEFLSLASHQLRSPLTAIKGYSSMILEGSYGEISNDAQKEAISRVFQSSQNLAKVVDDLLDISKIEQGGMQYEFAMVDVEKLASSITEEFSLSAKNKNLELDYSMDGHEPYLVKADLIKLRQVFLNFIDNSIKYTNEGAVHVRVEKDPTLKKIIFSVSDTGMGMAEETKTKLFQKFSRGEGGKVNAGGSGLGLYLAREIIEAHGGKVWADSPGVGKGSTFYVELQAL